MVRLFKSSMISSNTKATAAMGALKAAASPAAAPHAVSVRILKLESFNFCPKTEASPPASCTDGPSRPRLNPPPTLRVAATNFTQTMRKEICP